MEMEMEMEMEGAECPVCLEPYESESRIPRVLACGHSLCQLCLTHLFSSPSSSLSGVIRCPVCTQLVKFSHPTHLPKNIDLLRYSTPKPKPKNPHKIKPIINPPSTFPLTLSSELYAAWKDWVLPNNAILKDNEFPNLGTINFVSPLSSLFVKSLLVHVHDHNHKVGLVQIGRFDAGDSLFEYGYLTKVMHVLGSMNDHKRTQLGCLLGVSLRRRRLCRFLGLWLDQQTGSLFMVSEKMCDDGLVMESRDDEDIQGWMSCLCSIAAELCEGLIGLRSEGIVCGCFGLSCVCFDEFGHLYVDLTRVLLAGRSVYECVLEGVNGGTVNQDLFNRDVLVCPEVVLELLRMLGIRVESEGVNTKIDCSSDVWLFASVLLKLIIGDQFVERMRNYWMTVVKGIGEGVSDWKVGYMQWVGTLSATLESVLGSGYESLQEVLIKCLDVDPVNRPVITDVWKVVRGSDVYRCSSRVMCGLDKVSMKEESDIQCIILGELCKPPNDKSEVSASLRLNGGEDNHEKAPTQVRELKVGTMVEGFSAGKMQCNSLQGHLDCVTSLCIGGGFLFSASFDKTINVWSLQDFTHVHTFRGHEHKVMAVVFIDQEKPLCISADNGGGVFCWEVGTPFGQEPVKKWCEENDWRYSGIHALAVSESGCLYTGSGDRLVKAWSLRDYTLLCCMEGHKSVVSTLAVCNAVLYSGSWDGTVRLWSLHDHTPLAVFGEGTPGRVSSVLSLHVDLTTVIATHENGCVKIWVNDELKSSTQVHNGSIFAISKKDKWIFTGGWDRTAKVQETIGEGLEMEIREVGSVACDSVITALLYEQGMLFVGCANKLIKVYHTGP